MKIIFLYRNKINFGTQLDIEGGTFMALGNTVKKI